MVLQLWAWARSMVGELQSCQVCQDKKKKKNLRLSHMKLSIFDHFWPLQIAISCVPIWWHVVCQFISIEPYNQLYIWVVALLSSFIVKHVSEKWQDCTYGIVFLSLFHFIVFFTSPQNLPIIIFHRTLEGQALFIRNIPLERVDLLFSVLRC